MSINPSKCAIMHSDSLATLSEAYKDELLSTSSFSNLLRFKPPIFVQQIGVPI